MLIAIDAGHALTTAGKQTPKDGLGNVIKEAEQNYPIMFRLAEKLRKRGIDVVMTNSNINYDMPLSDRVKVANNNNADLFISIHKNAGPKYEWSTPTGTETIIYALGGEAEKIARVVHKSIIDTSKDFDRGVKVMNLQVLRETKMPAMLLELGFMTNRIDVEDMLNPEAHEMYAEAIAQGIFKYYNIQEPKVVESEIIKTVLANLKAQSDTVKRSHKDFDALLDELFRLINEKG